MSNHESNNHVWVALAPVLALALLAPVDAWAQPPAAGPDEAACQGKQSGDACSRVNGSAGTCGPGTCSRLDYSQGSPPRASEEPCTVCSVASASTSTGGPPVLGETNDTNDTNASAATSKDPSSGEPESSEVDDPPKTSSRCSVTDRSTPSDLGWLGLLGAVAVGLAGRRRKRKLR